MASRAASDQVTETEPVVARARPPLPPPSGGRHHAHGTDGSGFVDDRVPACRCMSVVEATVVAADLAYDIQEQLDRICSPRGPRSRDRQPGVAWLYIHGCMSIASGLKAFALESRHLHHRIYAIAAHRYSSTAIIGTGRRV
jgi:hypothetical protein